MTKNKEKTKKRPHVIPMDYIEAVADRIHTTNPGMEITKNTIAGVASTMYARGYGRSMDDQRLFRAKRAQTIEEDWNRCKDAIDDIINNK